MKKHFSCEYYKSRYLFHPSLRYQFNHDFPSGCSVQFAPIKPYLDNGSEGADALCVYTAAVIFFLLCLCPPPLDSILISRSESQHRGPGPILNVQIQLWSPKFSLESPNPALLHKSKHMKVLGCPFRDLKIWIWEWLKNTFLIYIMQSTTSQEPSLFWFQSLFCVWYTGYVSSLDTWILTLTRKLI